MGDLNDYTVFRRRSLGYQFNLPKLELKLTEQQLQVNGDDANYWLVPTSFAIREFGEKQILRLIGKYVDPIDRRSYLTQVPAVVNQNSSSLSLYTDNTPDPFSRDNQFGIGVKGFGFGSQGSIFLQGTSDRPGSNLYNSFQFNILR